jgi:hypothetical protein
MGRGEIIFVEQRFGDGKLERLTELSRQKLVRLEGRTCS